MMISCWVGSEILVAVCSVGLKEKFIAGKRVLSQSITWKSLVGFYARLLRTAFGKRTGSHVWNKRLHIFSAEKKVMKLAYFLLTLSNIIFMLKYGTCTLWLSSMALLHVVIDFETLQNTWAQDWNSLKKNSGSKYHLFSTLFRLSFNPRWGVIGKEKGEKCSIFFA